MTTGHVIVVGCGVAGTAAAVAARGAGARVTIVSNGDGASRMMSGALDSGSWELDRAADSPGPDLDPTIGSLCGELGIWQLAERSARVATPFGVTRPARGRDRAVLDISTFQRLRVAIPRAQRADWNADLLADGWQSDPWCKARELRFETVTLELLEHEYERWMTDAELAAELDDPARLDRLAGRLRDRLSGFDAVLTGPWLGVDTDAARHLSSAIGRPVGEALSFLGSTAGWRFTRARDRLFAKLDVTVVDATVQRVVLHDDRVAIHCDGEPAELAAGAVVVAVGGFAGGGLAYGPAEAEAAADIPVAPRAAFALSCHLPAALGFTERRIAVPGSQQGPNLEQFDWPSVAQQPWALDRVALRHRAQVCLDHEGNELARVLAAGEIAATREIGVLGCLSDGLKAGRAAALTASGQRSRP